MDKVLITDDGTDTIRVQLNDLPRRLMPRADLHILLKKAVEEGAEIEMRNTLGTSVIEGRDPSPGERP